LLIISNISFSDISAKTENGILIVGETELNHTKINSVKFSDINLEISKWSNVTRPFGRDFRPSQPETVPASLVPINGIFIENASGVIIIDAVIQYIHPWQNDWSLCINKSSHVLNFIVDNLSCFY
jgi:hypothetical protein